MRQNQLIDSHKLFTYIEKFKKKHNYNISTFCEVAGISRNSYYQYQEGKATYVWMVQKIKENIWNNTCDKDGRNGIVFELENIF